MLIHCTGHLKYFKQRFENIKSEISLTQHQDQYCPILASNDKYYYRNDWGSILFRALLVLKKNHLVNVQSFCTIGTGIGLDAIAAVEALNPNKIVLTDTVPNIATVASRNLKLNLKKPSLYTIETCDTFLFEDSDFFAGRRFDLIYENLPNLPEELLDDQMETYIYASFTPTNQFSDVPEIYKKHLLFTHYKFLEQAKSYLSPDGCVLCNIGARIDKQLVFNMFSELHYKPIILVYDLKRQTEARTNIPAYLKHEKKNSIEFKFYSYSNDLLGDIKNLNGYDKYSGFANDMDNEIFKELLSSIKCSPSEANQRIQDNKHVAHEVITILGVPL